MFTSVMAPVHRRGAKQLPLQVVPAGQISGGPAGSEHTIAQTRSVRPIGVKMHAPKPNPV
jgi:hypothetical protein